MNQILLFFVARNDSPRYSEADFNGLHRCNSFCFFFPAEAITESGVFRGVVDAGLMYMFKDLGGSHANLEACVGGRGAEFVSLPPIKSHA